MLPRKLHLEQINRFHNKIEELQKAITACGDREDLEEYRNSLALQYFKLTSVWNELDNVIEMKVKHTIDFIDE